MTDLRQNFQCSGPRIIGGDVRLQPYFH
jgi:hypothetical protein